MSDYSIVSLDDSKSSLLEKSHSDTTLNNFLENESDRLRHSRSSCDLSEHLSTHNNNNYNNNNKTNGDTFKNNAEIDHSNSKELSNYNKFNTSLNTTFNASAKFSSVHTRGSQDAAASGIGSMSPIMATAASERPTSVMKVNAYGFPYKSTTFTTVTSPSHRSNSAFQIFESDDLNSFVGHG
eukprot:Awhi_evm1s10060